jgi:hypothetical protein
MRWLFVARSVEPSSTAEIGGDQDTSTESRDGKFCASRRSAPVDGQRWEDGVSLAQLRVSTSCVTLMRSKYVSKYWLGSQEFCSHSVVVFSRNPPMEYVCYVTRSDFGKKFVDGDILRYLVLPPLVSQYGQLDCDLVGRSSTE